MQPGPGGKPYTLADLQRLAAANSPTLRQAASDVEAAKGNLIQAKTYPNPTIAYMQTPSNNNNTGQETGGSIDQPIIMGGKQKLGSAASQKDLDNAILALKRARSDLSTAVRTAYFAVLVDVETLAVNRALAQFSDEIYRLQTGLLRGAQAAPYEPTALRAQAFTVRLAYKQAIASYIYDWKTLVATLGLPQLPLTEIAGQVDRFIPYYDYDEVRAYVLRNHTDILTARNGLRKAQYNLKLTQVTPVFPDLDVTWTMQKDFGNPPFGTYQLVTVGFPAAHLGPEQGEHHRHPGRAGPRQRGVASGRSHIDQWPGPGLRRLQKQPVRHGILSPQRLAGPGPLLPGRFRTPPDRPQLGLRRPGGCPTDVVVKRHGLPRHPQLAVVVGGERGRLLADRRLVPGGEAARAAAIARFQ